MDKSRDIDLRPEGPAAKEIQVRTLPNADDNADGFHPPDCECPTCSLARQIERGLAILSGRDSRKGREAIKQIPLTFLYPLLNMASKILALSALYFAVLYLPAKLIAFPGTDTKIVQNSETPETGPLDSADAVTSDQIDQVIAYSKATAGLPQPVNIPAPPTNLRAVSPSGLPTFPLTVTPGSGGAPSAQTFGIDSNGVTQVSISPVVKREMGTVVNRSNSNQAASSDGTETVYSMNVVGYQIDTNTGAVQSFSIYTNEPIHKRAPAPESH